MLEFELIEETNNRLKESIQHNKQKGREDTKESAVGDFSTEGNLKEKIATKQDAGEGNRTTPIPSLGKHGIYYYYLVNYKGFSKHGIYF